MKIWEWEAAATKIKGSLDEEKKETISQGKEKEWGF